MDPARLLQYSSVPVLLLGTFVFDLLTPLGYADGILYLLPLALSFRLLDYRATLTVAASSTTLIVAGYFLSPPGTQVLSPIFNRTLSIAAVWLAMFVRRPLRVEPVSVESGAAITLPIPEDEAVRLQILHEYGVLDTPPERELDDLTQLAADICETPIALISLVDSDRQWFKSKFGLNAEQTSRHIAFCAHTILGNEPLVVPDALTDERFRDNPLVTGEPHIRFYYGMPLIAPEGYRIGTLSVIDHAPRTLTARQQETMRVFSRQVIKHLMLNRSLKELASAHSRLRETYETLRLSEEKFRTLSDSSPSAIFIHRDDRILYANRAAALISGYAVNELLAMNIWDMAHPDSLSMLKSRAQAVRDGDPGPTRFEFKFIRKDGQERWIDFAAGTIEYDGRPARLATGYDITRRKQALAALHEAERLNQSVLDSLSANIAVLDGAGTIVAVNTQWAHFADQNGSPPLSAVGSGVNYLEVCRRVADTECGFGEAREALTGIRSVLDRGRDRFSCEYPCHSPTEQRWFLMTVTPLLQRDGAVVTHINVTDRKLAEQAVRRSETLLGLFVEHAPAALAMFDREMRYLYASRRWRRDYGLGKRDLRGLSHYEVFPNIPEQWKVAHRRGLAGETVWEDRDCFVRPDGSVQWLRWEIRPWLDAAGIVGGIVLFTEDITVRVQAEANLKTANERLRELAFRIQTVVDEEQKRIARELHDEFGQTLTAVKFDLKKLAGQLRSPSKITDPAKVLAQIESLSGLTESLSQSSRKLAYSIRPGMLDDLGLADALRCHVDQFRERTGVRCNISLDEHLTKLDLEDTMASALFRIAQELLTNVARHAEASEVNLELDVGGGRVILTVSDNGRGIAREDLAKRSSFGLLGIRERVSLLDGTCTIDGQPGRGTTVTVQLPLRILA